MVAEDIIISCLLVSCLVLFCLVRHCTNKDWPIQIILPCFSIAIRSSRMSPCWMSSSWYACTDLYPASKLSSQRVVDGTKSAPFPLPPPHSPSPILFLHSQVASSPTGQIIRRKKKENFTVFSLSRFDHWAFILTARFVYWCDGFAPSIALFTWKT